MLCHAMGACAYASTCLRQEFMRGRLLGTKWWRKWTGQPLIAVSARVLRCPHACSGAWGVCHLRVQLEGNSVPYMGTRSRAVIAAPRSAAASATVIDVIGARYSSLNRDADGGGGGAVALAAPSRKAAGYGTTPELVPGSREDAIPTRRLSAADVGAAVRRSSVVKAATLEAAAAAAAGTVAATAGSAKPPPRVAAAARDTSDQLAPRKPRRRSAV